MEGSAREIVEDIQTVEPTEIGVEARQLDRRRTAAERTHLPASTWRRLGLLAVVYVVGLAAMATYLGPTPGEGTLPLVPAIVLVAFTFELMDSASGMGFGTALAPLLFVLGYDPLQVAPVLLVSETITGVVSGGVHHEFENVRFSIRPLNDATRTVLLLGGVGAIATIGSILLVYVAFDVPDAIIETYVSALVLVMGAMGLLRARLQPPVAIRTRRLVAFVCLAGFNKGIGGGGYGPVVTLGLILSGVYEKSATAITALSESLVSLVGMATFFALSTEGVPVDYTLLPSIFAGGFLAAVGAPYLVRVVPNRVWRYVIPLYALIIGVLGLTIGLGV